ncbi:MAG TPA: hypothetical protein VGU20_28765 [Stellaceae bacterium]|nr:hypothetical protein [Stellaceae bacterium]
MEHICREPSLAQMLADPAVQALMASDGIDRAELDELIEKARRRMKLSRVTRGGC